MSPEEWRRGEKEWRGGCRKAREPGVGESRGSCKVSGERSLNTSRGVWKVWEGRAGLLHTRAQQITHE